MDSWMIVGVKYINHLKLISCDYEPLTKMIKFIEILAIGASWARPWKTVSLCIWGWPHLYNGWDQGMYSHFWLDPGWARLIWECACVTQIKWRYSDQLTHWGRVTDICVSELTIIGSDNGLSPGRRQAIIWTNARILLIRPLGTNFNEMLMEILTFSFVKMRLKASSAKWRPFCLGLNVLRSLGFFYLGRAGLSWRNILMLICDL